MAQAIWDSECAETRRRYDLRADALVPCSWAEYEWKEIYRRRAAAAIAADRPSSET